MNPNNGQSTLSPAKMRQYSHLHAQLAQLNANLADTQNLMRMTSAQASDLRFLGGYVGSLFMGAAKVLGEEGINTQDDSSKKDGDKGKSASQTNDESYNYEDGDEGHG
ncbi:conserved hypothetical protein [Trichophyton verrucosum HKI 0517]|uniref:DASH complex subunit Hsk3 like-domain-containing protein n=1 Tax=Trichophyton verrucosum (strain HKI 0517) TaxID=663202 RepID=D4DDF2_TRIVH|nr:uncharacterized protein TRV_05163 [Trichophyton verrucosum HKI 0517]EFE40125.1 conserved hypothetical protein [Trichophyton verrucosum HKI 0517]